MEHHNPHGGWQAAERRLQERADALHQLAAPDDAQPLSLHRAEPPPAPVRSAHMEHGLALRWAAVQRSRGVQHTAAAAEEEEGAGGGFAGGGGAGGGPLQLLAVSACRLCGVAGHAAKGCPLVRSAEEVRHIYLIYPTARAGLQLPVEMPQASAFVATVA